MKGSSKSYVAMRFLDYLAILVFVAFIIAGSYIFWQHYLAEKENTQIVSETKSVKSG